MLLEYYVYERTILRVYFGVRYDKSTSFILVGERAKLYFQVLRSIVREIYPWGKGFSMDDYHMFSCSAVLRSSCVICDVPSTTAVLLVVQIKAETIFVAVYSVHTIIAEYVIMLSCKIPSAKLQDSCCCNDIMRSII